MLAAMLLLTVPALDNAAKGDCLNLLAIIGVRLADFPAAALCIWKCLF